MLLREFSGYEVTFVEDTLTPLTGLQDVASGAADVDVEVWPTGKKALLDEIDAKIQRESHPAKGRYGFYIPKYMTDAYPEHPMEFYTQLYRQDMLDAYALGVKGEDGA